MQRSAGWIIVGLLSSVFAGAQESAPPATAPTPPRQSNTAAQGERRIRWACQQLKLNAEQIKQTNALMAIYNAELTEEEANTAELIQRIVEKFSELRAAQTAKNAELEAKIKAELNDLRPGVQAEEEFFNALIPHLTAEQKTKLAEVREQAAKVGAAVLRPIHILRVARNLALTAEQDRKLEVVIDSFRTTLMSTPTRNQEEASTQVDRLVGEVRDLLTPEQAKEYDRQVALLRVSAPSPGPIRLTPASAPADRPHGAPPASSSAPPPPASKPQ